MNVFGEELFCVMIIVVFDFIGLGVFDVFVLIMFFIWLVNVRLFFG